ncbi:MAG: antitoxin [Rhodanobacter sp.]
MQGWLMAFRQGYHNWDILRRNDTTWDNIMQTVKVFKLGKAQAVRIPVRYQFDTDEVEVFQRGSELVLRPKTETAADLFSRIRTKHGSLDIQRPPQGEIEPVEPLEL